jgi:hypothetical protein
LFDYEAFTRLAATCDGSSLLPFFVASVQKIVVLRPYSGFFCGSPHRRVLDTYFLQDNRSF